MEVMTVLMVLMMGHMVYMQLDMNTMHKEMKAMQHNEIREEVKTDSSKASESKVAPSKTDESKITPSKTDESKATPGMTDDQTIPVKGDESKEKQPVKHKHVH